MAASLTRRRFPPPWTVEALEACSVVLPVARIQAAGILGKKRIRKVRNDYTNEPLPILEDRCRLRNKNQVRTAKSRNPIPIFRGVIVRLV
jgi:hypothetical protein